MNDDLIKRSDAIRVTWQEPTYTDPLNVLTEVRDRIEAIPSADNEVIGKLKTVIENEEICKNCPTAERISGENLLGAMALGFSYGMEADRPQGEWVWHEDEDICNCSECEFEIDATGCIEPMEYVGVFRYCPNCGAKMKGADE